MLAPLMLKRQGKGTVLPEPAERWSHGRIALWGELTLRRCANIAPKQRRSEGEIS